MSIKEKAMINEVEGSLLGKLKGKLLAGSERTQTVKKNVLGSFAIKGLSIITSLLLVPFTIKMLDQERYGVWITIYSIVTWMNMMDVGLGNGFRNKFTEAVAKGEKALAREYVQTFYSAMALISLSILLVYSAISPWLNWQAILNVNPGFNEDLTTIVWVVFALFCLQLWLKNISTILLSLQKTTFSNSLLFVANLLSLIIIFVLRLYGVANLFTISIAFMSTPVLVYLTVTIYLFSTNLKEYAPRLSVIPAKIYLRNLMGLGIKFFFIQITTIILFSTDSIVITQLYGPKEVTPYNISYRLFSSALIFLQIIVTPFWSAFTEANAKNDQAWIKRSMSNLIKTWWVFSAGIMVLSFLSPYIIKLWVGNEVHVPYSLAFQFGFYAIIMGWNNPFVFYVSSIGKIKLELWIALVQCIITIPITVFCAKNLNLGTTGVMLGTNIVLIIPAILIPIQYYKLINGKAKGIWAQ